MQEVKLKNVPQTMLWTLHNRATEAMRKDGIIKDERAIEIYHSIKYDYEGDFGKGEPSHAVRSLTFDKEIRNFIQNFPGCSIVNLGEGLETQRFRFSNENATWISVDLPDAIELREQFIQTDERHLHASVSALDRKWFELIPKDKPIFISAQGLFMYFNERDVKSLILDIVDTFKTGCVMFDTIPVWLSKKTISAKGWRKTKNYTTPKMPWGINRNRINEIDQWSHHILEVNDIPYEFPKERGIQGNIFNLFARTPILGRYFPTMVKIKFENKR